MPIVNAGQLQVTNEPISRRRVRRPVHTFQVDHKPWVVQPFMIAPLLPGESIDNVLLQCRAVTDPITNPIIGWWLEHWLFIVKHRDLVELTAENVDVSDDLQKMMLQPGTAHDTDLVRTTTSTILYSADGALDIVQECLNRIVDVYFRDGDENYSTAAGKLGAAANQLLAHVNTAPGWTDSLQLKSELTDTEDVELLDISAATTFEGSDDKVMASEIENAMRQWQLLRVQGLTTQTYDEYLMTYGVRPQLAELHLPELVRYSREWQYPSNTIDPTNGTPRSAVSWSIAERADKRRFVSEPAYLFGVTCARPKVYFSKQIGNATGFLDHAYHWLPRALYGAPQLSKRLFSEAADGILDATVMTADYVADMKDLYEYGDQYVNFSLSSTGKNLVALPDASAEVRYVTETDIDGLFVSGTNDKVRQDGIVNLTIMTNEVPDLSPRGTGSSRVIV